MSGYDKIKAIIVHKYGKPPEEMDLEEVMKFNIEAWCDRRFAEQGINAYIDENGETYYVADGIKKSQKEIDILDAVANTLNYFTFESAQRDRLAADKRIARFIEKELAEKGLK